MFRGYVSGYVSPSLSKIMGMIRGMIRGYDSGHDSGYDSRKRNMHVIINFVYAISGNTHIVFDVFGSSSPHIPCSHHISHMSTPQSSQSSIIHNFHRFPSRPQNPPSPKQSPKKTAVTTRAVETTSSIVRTAFTSFGPFQLPSGSKGLTAMRRLLR